MGIFDIFTGDSAKEAAAQNTARLAGLKKEGMAYLDAGKTGALGALGNAGAYFAPLSAKYGAGTDLYLDSLGVNGPQGNQRATAAFQASPGYQFGVDQSLDALDRRAASRGLLASGNTSLDTLKVVHGLADQEYGDYQNRLAGLVAPELTATTGQATAESAKAPVYTNDANARVGLASGVTTGINNQATQAANAQMQGSANIFSGLLNLGKLGVDFAGTKAGTSLLGF